MVPTVSFDPNSIDFGVVPPGGEVTALILSTQSRARIQQRSKRLFFGLGVLALPLGMLYATSLAQAEPIGNYACAEGQGTNSSCLQSHS